MDKAIVTLYEGTTCSAWNYSGQRLAAGSIDGTLAIYDSTDPDSFVFNRSSKVEVHETGLVKVVWVPPEYGDGVACISDDGTLSLWEELSEDSETVQWVLCKSFDRNSSRVLDIQFGVSLNNLKLVVAYSDGHVKIFELLDPLNLKSWQIQAEFQNAIDSISKFGKCLCLSASIAWNPSKRETQQSSFVLGFNSDTPQLNSSKVWEFDQDHQRWLPVAELALPSDKGDQVFAIAWAPNIGRPYEVIAVSTCNGIAIWHVGSEPDPDGRLAIERVALLSSHDNEVWQLEWDMSGMTLATTGSDGLVRLWQSNLDDVWHQKAIFDPTTS
ncbi:unnamed protein product [Cuscuta campestris]|uniref:Anaphase-promoting complex subunit 4 WD40 domain-containing protein n=1 Tax=Cuscuta campestris TaxID=132261 RepID=A0A484KWX3_9ASTE|nr:unnamed protein product [Cuscuta campestris]